MPLSTAIPFPWPATIADRRLIPLFCPPSLPLPVPRLRPSVQRELKHAPALPHTRPGQAARARPPALRCRRRRRARAAARPPHAARHARAAPALFAARLRAARAARGAAAAARREAGTRLRGALPARGAVLCLLLGHQPRARLILACTSINPLHPFNALTCASYRPHLLSISLRFRSRSRVSTLPRIPRTPSVSLVDPVFPPSCCIYHACLRIIDPISGLSAPFRRARKRKVRNTGQTRCAQR